MDRYLTTEEAAELLSLHPGTLKNWRSQGLGPKFCKPQGAVRYRLSDIDEWMDSQSRPLTKEEEVAD